MKLNRRGLLKIAGLTLLGLTAKPGWELVSQIKPIEPSPAPNYFSGKKWGMAIDLKKCWEAEEENIESINACHRIHNVPSIQSVKEEIKWIWTIEYEKSFPEHVHDFNEEEYKGRSVMVLCNQCDDPPCIKYCPTRATWKREDGIILMDFHRCIGCRYCMAGCPYGARSFNWRDPRPFIKKVNLEFPTRTKGVVEKCNFCEERLSRGLLPACVEARKDKALIFGDLNDPHSEIRKAFHGRHVLQRQPKLGTKPKVFYVV